MDRSCLHVLLSFLDGCQVERLSNNHCAPLLTVLSMLASALSIGLMSQLACAAIQAGPDDRPLVEAYLL